MHVGEQLHQILAEAIRTVSPGIDGKKGNHVDVDVSGFVKVEVECGSLGGRARAKDGFVLLPLAVEAGEGCSGDLAAAVGECGAQAFGPAGSYVGRKAVFGIAFHTDATKTGIRESEAGLISAYAEIVRVRRVERIFRAEVQFSPRCPEFAFWSDRQDCVPAG